MEDSCYEKKSYLEHFKRVGGSKETFDRSSRELKAKKIIAVLEDYAKRKGISLKNLICLDIGCSIGIITNALSDHFKKVIGLDTDRKALELARAYFNRDNLLFREGNAMSLPFGDKSFDVVVCNQVYEHVPDYRKLFSEIHRILKIGGFCYLAAGNKFNIVEPHYKLPFLSWLPRWVSNLYLRLSRKGMTYEEKHLSFWKIKMALQHFKVKDYTIDVIKYPEKYHITDLIKPSSLITGLPSIVLKLLEPIVPSFIFILEKK